MFRPYFFRPDPDAIEEVAPGWECQEVAEGNIIVLNGEDDNGQLNYEEKSMSDDVIAQERIYNFSSTLRS